MSTYSKIRSLLNRSTNKAYFDLFLVNLCLIWALGSKLCNFSKKNLGQGLYIHIKESKVPKDNKNAIFTQSFPTTLKKLEEKEFDMILEHGYEACKIRMGL